MLCGHGEDRRARILLDDKGEQCRPSRLAWPIILIVSVGRRRLYSTRRIVKHGCADDDRSGDGAHHRGFLLARTGRGIVDSAPPRHNIRRKIERRSHDIGRFNCAREQGRPD